MADRRTTHRLIIVVVILLVLGAGAGGGWWLTHPDVVPAYADGFSATGTLRVGEPSIAGTMLITVTGHDAVEVRIHDVTANIASNTAEATIQFDLCRGNGSSDTVGILSGDNLAPYCRSVVPPIGAKATLIPRIDDIVAVITARRPGTLQINGFSLNYSKGIRFQTQTGGVGLQFTATAK